MKQKTKAGLQMAAGITVISAYAALAACSISRGEQRRLTELARIDELLSSHAVAQITEPKKFFDTLDPQVYGLNTDRDPRIDVIYSVSLRMVDVGTFPPAVMERLTVNRYTTRDAEFQDFLAKLQQ